MLHAVTYRIVYRIVALVSIYVPYRWEMQPCSPKNDNFAREKSGISHRECARYITAAMLCAATTLYTLQYNMLHNFVHQEHGSLIN